MLVTEEVDGFQSCSLDGVNETITTNIDLDGLPLRTERVLRNSHLDSASRNTFLSKFHSVVLWRLGIEE
jgi:hypothetical protein